MRMLRAVAGVPATERAEARAGRLEAETSALRTERDELSARVAELAGQVAALQESLTTLRGVAFWLVGEGRLALAGNGWNSGDRPAGAGKRRSGRAGPGDGRQSSSRISGCLEHDPPQRATCRPVSRNRQGSIIGESRRMVTLRDARGFGWMAFGLPSGKEFRPGDRGGRLACAGSSVAGWRGFSFV
jgi:hypothetical protein